MLVRLLHIHGADLNKPDLDTWTPLHAAAANGHHTIVAYLLSHGADRNKRTEDGEMPMDLVEEEDIDTLAEFKNSKEETEKLRRLSAVVVVGRVQEKKEPAWVRRMSLQEAARKETVTQEKEADTRRKGSAWVGKEEIPEEEETDEDVEDDEEKNKNQKEDKKTVNEENKAVNSQKISKTTIIVSKEKDDDSSTKLKEQSSTDTSKLKEVCNSKSKEDCNARTTRQRRQGRLELDLEDQPEGIRSQFLRVTTDTSFNKHKSQTEIKPKTVKLSENGIKFSENEKLSTSSNSKER